MILRRIFIAGLLGCTMLAGCDGDDQNKNTVSEQGTFDQKANKPTDQLNKTIATDKSSTTSDTSGVKQEAPATPLVTVEENPDTGRVPPLPKRGNDEDLVPFVNPFVGTAGTTSLHSEDKGQTYPAVGVPFGMTQWTPATNSTEIKGTAPYYYGDTTIQGFRGSHFLSGSAVQEYGSIQLFAGQGAKEKWTPGLLSAKLSHENEKAGPDLYEVELPDRDISVSMTGTARCGLIPGLISLQKGGEAGFLAKLDALFAGKGKGYYWHGNEPSHHIAYLFNYAGAPAKTQKHVEEQRRTQYLDAPDGLFGNDDAGQMSAWYAFSALGFYPVTPGIPAYAIGSPLFSNAKIQLEDGKTFEVIAERSEGMSAKDAPYIESAILNGKPLQRYWIRHSEITAGGKLTFKMSQVPSINWPQDRTPPGSEPVGPQIVQ